MLKCSHALLCLQGRKGLPGADGIDGRNGTVGPPGLPVRKYICNTSYSISSQGVVGTRPLKKNQGCNNLVMSMSTIIIMTTLLPVEPLKATCRTLLLPKNNL